MAKQSNQRNDEVAMPQKEEFLDRLQELAAASCNTRSGRHRAAFLAVRELVETALGNGYAAKLIWQQLSNEGRIAMNYATFRGHCRAQGLTRRSTHKAAGGAPSESGPRHFVHSSVPRPRDKLV